MVRSLLPTIATRALEAVLATALLAAAARSQQPMRPPLRELPEPQEFVTGQDDNLFSLLRSQDNIHEFEQALAELARDDAVAAVERLHRLLQNDTGGVVPIGPGRFLGLRLAAVTRLANLPPTAGPAYEALVAREAGALATRPALELDEAELLRVADRYPTAAIGRAARHRLGDLALEAGRGLEAAAHFRLLLDATRLGSQDEQRILERLACAKALVEPRTARADADAGTLAPCAGDVLDVLPATGDRTGYAAAGGGGDGRLPMDAPAGRPAGVAWSEEVMAPGFDRRESGSFAMIPVGDLDAVFVNTGLEVKAFDPLRKELRWESASPLRAHQGDHGGDRDYEDQINQDCVLAPACGDDVVVAALQVPERSANIDFQGHFRIISKIPLRRLFAFSRASGKLLWAHFDEIDGPIARRFRGHDACGPPLVLGDTVYAPIHDRSGAIAFAVAAYDLQTGRPKWRRLVCSSQQDVNMFGNARMEFTASPLGADGGVLFGASNLGVCYAIEMHTGRLRWITAYDVVQMPRTMLHGQNDRTVYFANNAPVVADGVVCCTPLDSQFVLGIDTEQGRPLWRMAADATVGGTSNHVRWLAGAFDDEFVLTGHGAVLVRARPRRPGGQADVEQLIRPDQLRERADGRATARPAVTADQIWFAGTSRIVGFDRTGTPLPAEAQIRVPRYQAGNLLLTGGLIVSLRQRALDVLFDGEALLHRVQERLRRSPDDPGSILRLATLRSALLPATASSDERRQLTELYRRGLQACRARGLAEGHPVRQALQRELFEQALAAAASAVSRRDADRTALLVEAREMAPDAKAWLRVQAMLVDQLGDDPAALRREFDRLEQTAPQALLPVADSPPVPVRAYVLWRRAQLPDEPPADAVLLWQELLERFPDAVLQREPARRVAEVAIEALMARHGPDAYAAVAARAAAALHAAGEDRAALRDVSERYPNSAAAAAARTRLLDLSVAAGDLATASEVLAHALQHEPPAAVLRRVLAAAAVRGNRGLARAMADRLAAHADEVSDWGEDRGAPYGSVLPQLRARLAEPEPAPALAVPAAEVARIPARSPRESYKLMQVLHADGFDVPRDEPLFVVSYAERTELVAIDLHTAGPQKPVLFTLPIAFVDHVVLCGTTLVVPDLQRLFALDYRTGEVRWELPNADDRSLDHLGVQAGVLHLSAQSNDPDGDAEFLGVEPLTGSVLFTRSLPGDRMRPVPKPVERELLLMEAPADADAAVHRVDPVSGRTTARVRIDRAVLRDLGLRADDLYTRAYPQHLCADRERVFLPIDAAVSGDVSRIVAVGADGEVAWTWRGHAGLSLLMAARRGDRLIAIEGSEERTGFVTLLAADTGKVLRDVAVGADIDVLNWRRLEWLANPAPRIVLLADLARPGNRERRITGVAVDDDAPTFLFPLQTDDGETERQPLVGTDFVTFGVRPQGRGALRLYCLRLADRSGALPDGAKYVRLPLGPTFGTTSVGPCTVISSTSCLLVLGPTGNDR
jgi:outer membrane protein assembly factor BamB